MAKKFDYQGAKAAGYSDEEIMQHLAQSRSDFDFKGAMEAGYSPAEINEHLSTPKPKTKLEKGLRVGAQLGLGALENVFMPYELGVAPLASKEAQHAEYRKGLFEDIERLAEQKASGDWSPQDEQLFQHLQEQIKNPERAEQFVKTADIGVRGLAEKATGLDLHPEGILEKAAHWTGFIKNPKNIKELVKLGTSPKEITKALIPGKDAMRGLGAGTALQIAEEGHFGPIATMGAAIIGDLMGGGAAGVGKAITRPKETLAKGAALLANRKSAIINDLKEASQGKTFTKDLGSLTDNNVVQMIQARLAASGLTGKPLENLRKQMTQELANEYESVIKELGEARFESLHEAGEAGKETLTLLRDDLRKKNSEVYRKARGRLDENSVVNPTKLASSLKNIEEELIPGSVKSEGQREVLSIINDIKKDIYDSEGNIKNVNVKSLMNNKIALGDKIDWEVKGGAQELLKNFVKEIDKLIISYGHKDKEFLKEYVKGNTQFADYAKTFKNKNISNILRSENPETLMNKMNSVQGIKDLKKAFSFSPEGKEMFKALGRKKIDMIFHDTGIDGLKEQLKFGKFSNVLEKGKNAAIVKELLSKESFDKLLRLQKHTGQIAEAAQKFFNASQSGTSSADLKGVGVILMGIFGVFTGNPWAIAGATSIGGARLISGLIADPKFLSLVEDAIAVGKNNNISAMNAVAKQIMSQVKQSAPASVIAQER